MTDVVEHYTTPAAVSDQRGRLRADRSAVVVIDMVNWQVPHEPNATGLGTSYYVETLRNVVIPNHVRLVERAHELDVPVIFLRVGYATDDGRDVIAPFRRAFLDAGARDGSTACSIIDELRPSGRDVSLLKAGSGGYLTAALEENLRRLGVEHAIYTGVITNGCVLHTATAGFDLGFQGYVVSDATTTMNAATQDAALSLLGAYCAEVLTTDDLLARFGQSALT